VPKTSLSERARANKARRYADELAQPMTELRWARSQMCGGLALVFLCVLFLGEFSLMPNSTIGKLTQFLFAATYYGRGRGQLANGERSIGLDLTLMVLSLSTVAVVSGNIDLFQATSKLRALKKAHANDVENGPQ
jgi:hypothetical protein